MPNLGSSDTPVEGQNFGLPAGAELGEDNDELVIKDSSGTIILRRNETAGEWQFEGTDLTGINSIDASSASVGSLDTESLVIGGTIFQEDDNSPVNATGTIDTTITLANSAPQVVIIPDDSQDANRWDQIRVENDGGANYDIVDNADIRQTGLSQFDLGSAAYNFEHIGLGGLSGSRINLSAVIQSATTGLTAGGSNLNVSPPVTEITTISGGGSSVDHKYRVFRRSMNI